VGKNGVGERRRKTKTESVKEIRLHFPLVVSVTFPSRLFARCNFLFLPFYFFYSFFLLTIKSGEQSSSTGCAPMSAWAEGHGGAIALGDMTLENTKSHHTVEMGRITFS
jgi:hypothetical protein